MNPPRKPSTNVAAARRLGKARRAFTAAAIIFALLLLPAGTDGQAARGAEKPGEEPTIPAVLYIPTPHDVAARMLELAAVGKDDVVYDLGCGDGRIVVAAARQYGCRAKGVDIDPRRIEDSRANARRSGVEALVAIEQQDLFEVDLRPANVVVLYLSPDYNQRLLPQLDKLRPGARIVSHQFAIPGVEPQKTVRMRSNADPHEHTLYLWTAPLKTRD